MKQFAKRVILNSKTDYSAQHDQLLNDLIEAKVLLFCAVGKDCEMWHDIMDEILVGDGIDRDFFMVTTWHQDETLEEVIEFAKFFPLDDCVDDENVQVIEI